MTKPTLDANDAKESYVAFPRDPKEPMHDWVIVPFEKMWSNWFDVQDSIVDIIEEIKIETEYQNHRAMNGKHYDIDPENDLPKPKWLTEDKLSDKK